MNNLSIGYFADGPWSHGALEKFLNDDTLKINFICARNNNPDIVLRNLAKENSIDYLTHPNINSDEFLEKIKPYQCDILISMSFNQIFKSRLIDLTPLKAINCHAGKLPFYRGRNILNWALINDEKEFGITVHYIDEGIDTGDIILQSCYPILEDDSYLTLLERAYKACPIALYKAIKQIQVGGVNPIRQNSIDPLGSYCVARKLGDELINWNDSSRCIYNFVRAISMPGPRATTMLDDTEFKINKAQYIKNAACYKGIPGSVIRVEECAFYVKTSDSFIKIMEWEGHRKPRIGDRFV